MASFSKITPEPRPLSLKRTGVVSIRTIPRFTCSTIDLRASGRGEIGVGSTEAVGFSIGIGVEVRWGVAVNMSTSVGNGVGIEVGAAVGVGMGVGAGNPAMAICTAAWTVAAISGVG